MLKEWLTLDEAAARLSVSAGEVVTQADILRLAIDNHLQLSVFIDDNLTVRSMEFEVEEIDGMKCLMLGKGASEPCRINGLWDLAAYGEAVGELERLYREQKGFTPTSRIELSNMGLYLHDKAKTEVYEVLRIHLKFKFVEKRVDDDMQSLGSDVRKSVSSLTVDTDESLIGDINTLLKEGLGLHEPVFDEKLCSFYREHHFPKHCLIVLRREEMLAFENRHFGGSIKAELSPTERTSSHQIIAALASMANIDLSAPYKAVGILRREAELKGLELPSSDETIVKFLAGPTRKKR
ncbi:MULTISPECIES: hypothetical protein [unclassified Pseudomonas]|uniref:hypothetical protein n=1 Tax=unclassified Pseudomonas TaxID=196821 RepID=UPI000D34F15C|nr:MULTISPECIES: hypothetical protein [unclassified Pseudomonas]RAU43676.1 hypothetical protein DBP26_019295 [Pseudomonas sp. RIT 409]RAU54392.1 hypothetical protein DBY65_008675 [Pseudomonas sp. RIT 412]